MPEKPVLNSRNKKPRGLDFLFSDVQYLKGVGPRKGEALKKHGIKTVFDLFYYVPRKYLDRSLITPLDKLEEGMTVTVLGTVVAFGEVRRRKRLYKVIIENNRAELELVWFSGYRYLQNAFSEGDVICVSGTVRRYGGLNIPHPEFEVVGSREEETIHTGRLIPIYPENSLFKSIGLHSRGLRRIIKPALDHLAANPCETIPERWRKEYGLYDLTRAIYQIHFPDKMETADSGRQRLAFEELFYLELILAGRKNNRRKKMTGIKIGPPKKLGRRLLDSLGFKLTKAQVKVLNEIYADMAAGFQMSRVIQGDVGSGKTIVAVLAMLGAVENGFQAAIMAPTEILAEQHYFSISELLKPLDINTVLITGSIRGARRTETMEAIAGGRASVIIGTHALIQKKVEFKNLGFVVIDEQQRFGVAQRGDLLAKGMNPDILVMSATPIPRTLAMTIYGDLDISVIDEMPPGRIPVKTKHVPEDKRREMYDFVKNAVNDSQSAYVIYPLVEETEKSDLKAATEGFENLKEDVFLDLTVGLLHGRMKGEEKQKIMMAFRDREIDILVSTTVVEVGLDIPSATIMLVEHAERFGLSQLHQLRGRVGRSGIKSYCFLMTGARVSEEASRRIEALTGISDGFKISEIDLQLRGPGEILGTKQHGMPELKVADLTDTRLISLARRLAFDMIEEDPGLNLQENRFIKTVLKMRMGKKLKYSKIG
ncbi:MAG: ATP-dependent DNA helicase RecG [Candidatus Zixiibacteriota bacterium]|nr:MAG: ATP-dependent DNA helicase RecG [candidate division Zixibacteria bacterium]